ncbi:MAG: acetylxylan esterase [Calditrichaeota bacterium]|nr:acetylxylan esterase [Calditrichota bacterium]
MKYLILLCLLISCSEQIDPLEIVGRYENSEGELLFLRKQGSLIVFRPQKYRSGFRVKAENKNHYILAFRPHIQLDFDRDSQGSIKQMIVTGFGVTDSVFRRLGDDQLSATEELFAGRGKMAAKLFNQSKLTVSQILDWGEICFEKYPSKRYSVKEMLLELDDERFKTDRYYALLGRTYIATGDRDSAATAFQTAYQLNNKNDEAINGLQKMGLLEKAAGWNVPFDLETAFLPPRQDEIDRVKNDWKRRDLEAKDVQILLEENYPAANKILQLQIISHTVNGSKRIAAIIKPKEIHDKIPLILEYKGVSWNYSPRDLDEGIKSFSIIGDNQDRFIYALPAFGGEVINYKGVEYKSEGDPSKGWDGATDDAIALLNVVLDRFPQVDQQRIISFGASRGGTIALLSGIRDSRISYVIDWAGPSDWFRLMTYYGWTQAEIMNWALSNKSRPQDEGGQFIERFLMEAVQGKKSMQDVRLQMIAGSPLYFADQLHNKTVMMHYGIEDAMVPIKNGYEMDKAIRESRINIKNYSAFFHDDAGHDLDAVIALRETRKLINSILKE